MRFKKIFLLLISVMLLTGCGAEDKNETLSCSLEISKNSYHEVFTYELKFKNRYLDDYRFSNDNKVKFYSSLDKVILPVDVKNIDQVDTDDVVGFLFDDDVVTVHRIIEKFNDRNGRVSYVTKGDDNETQDRDTLTFDGILFKVKEDTKDIDDKHYDYVKKYFEDNGYVCK